jgi:hypothetical protein
MTGRLEAGEQEAIQALNVSAIIEKPFTPQTILAALRQGGAGATRVRQDYDLS